MGAELSRITNMYKQIAKTLRNQFTFPWLLRILFAFKWSSKLSNSQGVRWFADVDVDNNTTILLTGKATEC